jgi:hypothetical protein
MSEADATQGTPSPASSPDAAKPVKKRSPVERALVWGGISLMLMVVVFEWTSQSGYGGTLASFEEVLNSGKTIKLTDIQQHTRGYATRSEEKNGKETVVTLKWPSLFKDYSIYLPVEKNDEISAFETAESRANPPEPVAKSTAPTPDAMTAGTRTPNAADAPVDAPSASPPANPPKTEPQPDRPASE